MQRVAWTDERLDDLSHRVDRRFDRVDGEIRDLRSEMSQGFTVLRAELGQEIAELRTLMWRLNGGIIAAVVAAILLRGF
jgi:hypothetical protein